MTTPTYLISLCMLFGTILLMALMATFIASRRTRMQTASEESLRRIATEAAAAQSAAAGALAQVQAELAALNNRLGAVEKMLRDVE